MTVSRTLARALAAAASASIGLAGTVVLAAAPAQAAITVTDYGFQTLAYATRVQSEDSNVQSGRTAFAWLACTRLTGLTHDEDLAGADLPPGAGSTMHAQNMVSKSRTFRSKDGDVGTESISNVGQIVLGQPGSQIVIKGLKVTTRAWADRAGKLHSSASFSSADLSGTTGVPEIDDILGQAGAGIGDLLEQIEAQGGKTAIPGIGTLSVGSTSHTVKPGYAKATATVMRVRSESSPTITTIGQSWSRISRGLPAGLMQGTGYGADIPTILGGVAHVGRLGAQPLPCKGTDAKPLTTTTGGLNLGNVDALQLGQLTGRVWGVQKASGYASALTRGNASKVILGPLQINGIEGIAEVTQRADGTIKRSTTYNVDTMIVNGQEQPLPDPGEPVTIGQDGQDLMTITFGVKTLKKRSAAITAVTIKVLSGVDGVPEGALIRLGNARTAIKRY